MASNMTTKEKLMHPVTAVKEMMGKGGSHTTDTTGTHTGTHMTGTHTGTHSSSVNNEAGVIGRYEQPMTGVTQTTPTTMGNEEQLMTNELGGTPTMGTTAGAGARPVFSETGHQGVGPHQAKFGVDPASSAAAYEGQQHAGHLPGAGAVGMLGAAASKLMPGHHNKHTDTGVAHTGTTGVGTTKTVL